MLIEIAASSLAPLSILVNVVCVVVQRGRSELQANTLMVPAILAAGGSKHWRARRSNVELVRIHRNGTATRELLSIDCSQGVSGVRNSPLRNGDSVVGNNSTDGVTTYA